MSPSVDVVIVGNGVAGVTAASIIKEKNPEAKVSIYTDESHHYYPRPRLYKVLSREAEPREIYMFSEKWYEKRGINVHLNKKASSIDVDKKELLLENQSGVSYDKLLLANGGHSFIPPIKGVEKTGVFTLRSIRDALNIKEFTKKTKKAIVIGGGLLGLEFAASLRKLGQKVEVVVLSVDGANRRISLGLKQIQDNPWPDIAQRYPLDTVTEAEVVNITEFGVFVKLEEGLEGLVFSSENEPQQLSSLKPGDKLKTKVIKVDVEQAKIGLSCKL